MIPSLGRIVHYKLTEDDAKEINRRRVPRGENWPDGAQQHRGNNVNTGEVYPATIVRVWNPADGGAVNLQVHLDGNDVFWATSRTEGSNAGNWFAPPFVPQKT